MLRLSKFSKMAFELKFKFYWNLLLDNMKCKPVYRCEVFIRPGVVCNEFTRHKYCDHHWKLYRQECRKYHMLNVVDAELELVALVEYEQRLKFKEKYRLVPDDGHQKFEYFLLNSFRSKYEVLDNYVIDKNTKEADLLCYFKDILYEDPVELLLSRPFQPEPNMWVHLFKNYS